MVLDGYPSESGANSNGYQQIEHINRAPVSREPTWTLLSETMKRAAKTVCGLEDTRSKTSHWMRGHEDQVSEFKKGIKSAAKKRNAATNE